MRIGKVLLLAMTLTLGVSTAFAQSIDVTLDAAGTMCEGTAPAMIYILARPGGAVAGGITGAEFYVQGLPAGVFALPTVNPLAAGSSLGNPFSTVSPYRANVAFPACEGPDGNGVILLYSVQLFGGTAATDQYMTVVVADPPTNATFTTPILYGCDAPEYTPTPAAGGQFIYNPATRHCTVSVEAKTWSGVKNLFD